MSNKLLGYLTVGALAAALALASPALAGGHGGGGGGGGGHGMGGGGGGHAMGGGMGGGMGMHSMGSMGMRPLGGGPMSFSAVRAGASFAAMPTTRAAVSPRFAHFGFRHHHHFRRFFFVGGAPYYYSDYGYDDCLRRVWTGYGVQWVSVCGDYGY
jgi:hypothetical protein